MKKIKAKITYLKQLLRRTGFFHIFGSSVINQIIGFMSSIILVRVISKSQFGLYSYTYNIFSFFLLLSGLGLPAALLQICSEEYKNKEYSASIFKYGSKYAIYANIFLSMLIFLFSKTVKLNLEGANSLLGLMSLIPMFIIIIELMQANLRINRDNIRYSYITSLNTILVFIFSITGAISYGTIGLIAFRYLAYTTTIVIGINILKLRFKTIFKKNFIDKVKQIDIFKISFISMANNATGHLIYIVDIFIVGWMLPNESIIAAYKVATILPNALIFIPSSLMMYLYPYFAENNKNKTWVREKYYMIIKYFGLFNLILSIVVILFAPIIITVIFGDQYYDSILPFRILIAGYFFSSTFRKVIGNLLVTQRKLKFNFLLGVLEGLLNIIANIILVSKYGAVGAAISSLMVVIISSFIGLNYFKKAVL